MSQAILNSSRALFLGALILTLSLPLRGEQHESQNPGRSLEPQYELSSPFVHIVSVSKFKKHPNGSPMGAKCQATVASKRVINPNDFNTAPICEYGLFTAEHCVVDEATRKLAPVQAINVTPVYWDKNERGPGQNWRLGKEITFKQFEHDIPSPGSGIDAAWIYLRRDCNFIADKTVMKFHPEKGRGDGNLWLTTGSGWGGVPGTSASPVDQETRRLTTQSPIEQGNSGGAIWTQVGNEQFLIGPISSINNYWQNTKGLLESRSVNFSTSGAEWGERALAARYINLPSHNPQPEPPPVPDHRQLDSQIAYTPANPVPSNPAPLNLHPMESNLHHPMVTPGETQREPAAEDEKIEIVKFENGIALKSASGKPLRLFGNIKTGQALIEVGNQFKPVNSRIRKALLDYYKGAKVDPKRAALVEKLHTYVETPQPKVEPQIAQASPQPTSPQPASPNPLSPHPLVPKKPQQITANRVPSSNEGAAEVQANLAHYAGKCISCHSDPSRKPYFADEQSAMKGLNELQPGHLERMLAQTQKPFIAPSHLSDQEARNFTAREVANLKAFTNRHTQQGRIAPPAAARVQLVSNEAHNAYSNLLPKGCENDAGGQFLENLKTRGMVFYNEQVSRRAHQEQLEPYLRPGAPPMVIGATTQTTILDPYEKHNRTTHASGLGDGSRYETHGNLEFPWHHGAGMLGKDDNDQSFKFFVPPPTGPMAVMRPIDQQNEYQYVAPMTAPGFRFLETKTAPVIGAEYQVGTVLSEVVTVTDPVTHLTIPSVIRMMEMTPQGWRFDTLSLFDNSADMLNQVKQLAATDKWKDNPQVQEFIRVASDPASIKRENFLQKLTELQRRQNTMATKVMQNDALVQHLPTLPPEFIAETSQNGCFRSVMGKPWLEASVGGQTLTGWDPTSNSKFGFYKQGYQGAHVAKTTQSCVGCHSTALTHVKHYSPNRRTLKGSGGQIVGNDITDMGERDWYGHVRGSKGQDVAGLTGAKAGVFSLQLFDTQGISYTSGDNESRPSRPDPKLMQSQLIQWDVRR